MKLTHSNTVPKPHTHDARIRGGSHYAEPHAFVSRLHGVGDSCVQTNGETAVLVSGFLKEQIHHRPANALPTVGRVDSHAPYLPGLGCLLQDSNPYNIVAGIVCQCRAVKGPAQVNARAVKIIFLDDCTYIMWCEVFVVLAELHVVHCQGFEPLP